MGIPAMGNGAMANTICEVAGPEFSAIQVGLPSEVMLEALCRPKEEDGYAVDLSEAIMVGTSMDVDGKFATNSGMRSLLLIDGIEAATGKIGDFGFGKAATMKHINTLQSFTASCPTWVANT